jgi:hypothetical protein
MGTPTAGRLHMTRASGPSKELHALVACCRETRNPTVFWNKEDTPKYARLIETAKLFDHVFTVDGLQTTFIRDLGPSAGRRSGRITLLRFSVRARGRLGLSEDAESVSTPCATER